MALRRIYLHGRLANDYTSEIELDADDLRSVVAGIESNFNGFFNDFVNGEWHIVRGDFLEDNSDFMDNEEAGMLFGNTNEIHIIPKIEGAGGIWKVVIGVGLIALAFWTAGASLGALGVMGGEAFAIGGLSISFGNIAMFGLSMALSGIAQMLAPTPGTGSSLSAERAADRPSFMFNGAVNVMVSGGPVPLVYGLYETGSTVISAGITVDQIAI